ncbi:DUF1707 SHOCT-like domain-containing protein [Streptomyces sp. ECR3]|uniref:DUF1707 SHOCT-like domain-containing protein n=1 Tax=Streptomyces sp. ECR3 TaxID=3400630 RepID=UPI003F1AE3C5
MSDSEHRPTGPVTLASDAVRDRIQARLQHHYAVGRLTLPEFEERVAVACEARTREEMDALVRDLPDTTTEPSPPASTIDTRLLLILLCCSPPAALVYWLICQRAARRSASRRGRFPMDGLTSRTV